jgi:hypothetical protein
MKRLLLIILCLAVPGLAGAAPNDTTSAAVISAQFNARLRASVTDLGSADAARSALLIQAEKICATLGAAMHMSCAVNNIQFDNMPMGMPFGMQQPAGNFIFANVNFSLAPGH